MAAYDAVLLIALGGPDRMEVGSGFARAETVSDHPSFIRMLAAVVAAQAAA